MEASLKTARSSPHSVKRWQLSGTDYELRPVQTWRSTAPGVSETRFSSWTPLVNKQSNQQLFEERVNLLLHWFDLWTDRQRKHLLHMLLTRCTKSQLKYCRDWLLETLPVARVDAVAVLPRCLSLRVMSFLTPRDLCSAAQVSWHWRFLAEQDCLWAGRCVRRGWFLPYCPGEKEYGAWKRHYASCVATLDWLTPREAAELYGTLSQPAAGRLEEEEERQKERKIRQAIRERLQQEKRMSLRTRRAWGSNVHPGAASSFYTQRQRLNPGLTLSNGSSLSWPPRMGGHNSWSKEMVLPQCVRPENGQSFSSTSESTTKAALTCFTYRPQQPSLSPTHHILPVPLLLVSNRLPAYELVFSGVRAEVKVVLYDHRGTLSALLAQIERALGGQRAQRLGLLVTGGTEKIHLLHRISLSERTVLTPDLREFWEKLCGWVVPTGEGGGVDIFCPLAASALGVSLIQTLSTLTGLEVLTPMGLATGSFQNILSEWSSRDLSGRSVCEESVSPALRYVCEGALQGWCRQAWWMEETLRDLRGRLEAQLQRVSLEARGRTLGHFLWDRVGLHEVCASKELTEALTEGLTALTTEEETRPLEFLSAFLTKWMKKNQGGATKAEEIITRGGADVVSLSESGLQRHMELDWRGSVVRELYHSEGLFLARLGAVLKVYHEPLTAALNSNRPILSSAHIHMVLSPVTHILDVNRLFREELEARLERWGAEQCVGDVCVKLLSKLRVYTNYLNNYPTALRTADQCRENNPGFRAFLKRKDRTLATHMLSLQELLLCPVWRIEEYVTLLQALCAHTACSHPDHAHLTSALDTLLHYRLYIVKLKGNSERDMVMEEMQRMIQGCSNFCEGNRQLIVSQDAALLRSPDDAIPESLRMYEQVSDVGLFLFTDALVLTERNVCHTPFTLSQRNTHTFLASVALASLAVREITHTRYVCQAFILEGPRRSWVCAIDREEEKDRFLFSLRLAIHTAGAGQM